MPDGVTTRAQRDQETIRIRIAAIVIGISAMAGTAQAQDAGRTAMPADEAAVVDIIEGAANLPADISTTSLDRLRRARAKALCAALPNPVATAWLGTVTDFTPGPDGLVTIEVRLSSHLTIGTYADQQADKAADNDTRRGMQMPDLIDGWRPYVGEQVKIFGIFDRNGPDCWENKALGADAAMRDPDFAFSFTGLMPL